MVTNDMGSRHRDSDSSNTHKYSVETVMVYTAKEAAYTRQYHPSCTWETKADKKLQCTWASHHKLQMLCACRYCDEQQQYKNASLAVTLAYPQLLTPTSYTDLLATRCLPAMQ